MYTGVKDPLARLRSYRRELDDLYAGALARRDLPHAHQLQERRRAVQRAILVREEWTGTVETDGSLDRALAEILHGC